MNLRKKKGLIKNENENENEDKVKVKIMDLFNIFYLLLMLY